MYIVLLLTRLNQQVRLGGTIRASTQPQRRRKEKLIFIDQQSHQGQQNAARIQRREVQQQTFQTFITVFRKLYWKL